MVGRLILGLTALNQSAWFEARLPTAFHVVLAGFLLVLGAFTSGLPTIEPSSGRSAFGRTAESASGAELNVRSWREAATSVQPNKWGRVGPRHSGRRRVSENRRIG